MLFFRSEYERLLPGSLCGCSVPPKNDVSSTPFDAFRLKIPESWLSMNALFRDACELAGGLDCRNGCFCSLSSARSVLYVSNTLPRL